jgi:DNA modification methylase
MKSRIFVGDVLSRIKEIPDNSIQCVVTSPPYWGLRDYGHVDQLGLEETPNAYVENMVRVFREVRRVLKEDGVCWINLGDSYAGQNSRTSKGRAGFGDEREGVFNRSGEHLKPKDLVGIPWRVALALQEDGWWLRQDIIWHKPNPIPESVTDRCTKSHEYLFMLTKSKRYYFDNETIREPAKWERWGDQTETKKHTGTAKHLGGKTLDQLPIRDTKNKRSVWTIPTKPFSGAHFAVMPEALCEPPILATSKPKDTVLDPFAGSGTVGVVALRHNRNFVGIELNNDFAELALARIAGDSPIFNEVEIR